MADLAPTPERRRRSAFVVGPAVATESGPARAGSRVHRALSSIERMIRMATITRLEGLAADRLAADYELGIAGAREPASGSSSALGWGYPQARLSAVQRYQQAVRMLGPLAPYVLAIVIGEPGQGDVSIAELARRLRQSRQAVGGIVKLGLQALVAHYGIDERNSQR